MRIWQPNTLAKICLRNNKLSVKTRKFEVINSAGFGWSFFVLVRLAIMKDCAQWNPTHMPKMRWELKVQNFEELNSHICDLAKKLNRQIEDLAELPKTDKLSRLH